MWEQKTFIKPIETVWGGVKFRSRLEARWAVFFQKLNVYWNYEPFKIDSYTPDFLIVVKDKPWFVEIKPIVPNDQYVSYLKSIHIDVPVLIAIGNPTLCQKEGIGLLPNFQDNCMEYCKGWYLSNYLDKYQHSLAVNYAERYRFDLS